MRVHSPIEPDCRPSFAGDKENYYKCLARAMRQLHEAVKKRKKEIKQQDKRAYDKAHRVVTPKWTAGERVWLFDTRVKPGSDTILTKRRFHGPYIIEQVVRNDPEIGEAYKLVREKDGRALKFLVNSDRLKKYNTDRTKFNERLPRLYDDTAARAKKPEDVKTRKEEKVENKNDFEEALEIVDEQTVNGKKQYLVRFLDGTIHVCDAVTDALLRYYERSKARTGEMKPAQKDN